MFVLWLFLLVRACLEEHATEDEENSGIYSDKCRDGLTEIIKHTYDAESERALIQQLATNARANGLQVVFGTFFAFFSFFSFLVLLIYFVATFLQNASVTSGTFWGVFSPHRKW